MRALACGGLRVSRGGRKSCHDKPQNGCTSGRERSKRSERHAKRPWLKSTAFSDRITSTGESRGTFRWKERHLTRLFWQRPASGCIGQTHWDGRTRSQIKRKVTRARKRRRRRARPGHEPVGRRIGRARSGSTATGFPLANVSRRQPDRRRCGSHKPRPHR